MNLAKSLGVLAMKEQIKRESRRNNIPLEQARALSVPGRNGWSAYARPRTPPFPPWMPPSRYNDFNDF